MLMAAVRLAGRLRVIAPDRQLHLLSDGNWWEVMLASIPRTVVALPSGRRQLVDQPVVDVIERAHLSDLARPERYGRPDVYAFAKRPLSRKELKALKLRD